MGVGSLKQADTAAQDAKRQAVDHQQALVDTCTQVPTLTRPETAVKSAIGSEKQVKNATEKKTPNQAKSTHEMDVDTEEQMAIPAMDETFSVLSSDVSSHDSDFDFLRIDTDSDLSLLTPHRGIAGLIDTKLVAGPLVSPPLSSRGSSAACSPSRFFKSPLRTRVRASETSQRRNVVPVQLTTPRKLSEAIDLLSEQEEKTLNVDGASAVANLGIIEAKQGIWRENVVSTKDRLGKASTLATPPRTPSPSVKQQLLYRRLKDVFDDSEERETGRGGTKSRAGTTSTTYRVETSVPILDADDLHCVPSGLLASPSEHDSFFSFANSLSPLMTTEEMENSFVPVRLSPLVSLSSYELPRLLPPFPEQERDGDRDSSSVHFGTPLILKTPTTKSNGKRGIVAAGSFPGSATEFACESAKSLLLAESFPNIQAFTSATPGKDERSKLGVHRVMKMKLHASFGASPSLLDSHSTREIRAINNSLKRKKYMRRRRAEEKRQQTSSSNVQRKLLQTPVKASASSCPLIRSPLHPWNGQTSETSVSKTPTPRKLAPSQQVSKLTTDTTPVSRPEMRRPIPSTDPVAAVSTPVGINRKRKASQCASLPSSMANLIGLKMQKSPLGAVALAITPTKQIKREMTAKPGMLTQHMIVTSSGMDSSTSTPVGSSPSQTMSLQSTSEAPVGAAIMVIASQVPKKAPCNCKKSKCLKLYCECFRLGGYCDESCNCLDCANTTETEEKRQQAIASRLEKNPNAFKPKIGATPAIAPLTRGNAAHCVFTGGGGHVSTGLSLSPSNQMSFQQPQQVSSGDLATTKMHKHGCHCKKSACQKKYCECYQAGVPCGENCRCIDCKNQAPCVAHANGVATADSTLDGTPSRLANELDETFVSPVLRGVRQRMRIDHEIWRKNFSSPFETSPRRQRELTERLQSRQLASKSGNAANTRHREVPVTSPFTPQVKRGSGAKRSRDISPITGSNEERRGESSQAASTVMSLKERELQQCAGRIDNTAGKAALSAVIRSSASTKRVFVLPLFGTLLPPLECGVSAKIFCFLTNADLHNASLVSHLWNQFALGDTVWDHANFIPTEASTAGRRRSHKKKRLETRRPPSLEASAPMNPTEHDLAVLSTLR